jgi:hypothetical protein
VYKSKTFVADRCYRSRNEIDGVKEITSYNNKLGLIRKIFKIKINLLCSRSAIELIIFYLKADHRLSRNQLKGTLGDTINPLFEAAFNFLKCGKVEYIRLNRPPRTLP